MWGLAIAGVRRKGTRGGFESPGTNAGAAPGRNAGERADISESLHAREYRRREQRVGQCPLPEPFSRWGNLYQRHIFGWVLSPKASCDRGSVLALVLLSALPPRLFFNSFPFKPSE